MFVIKAGIHKMLVRIANREDPDQTASRLIWVCTVCLRIPNRDDPDGTVSLEVVSIFRSSLI